MSQGLAWFEMIWCAEHRPDWRQGRRLQRTDCVSWNRAYIVGRVAASDAKKLGEDFDGAARSFATGVIVVRASMINPGRDNGQVLCWTTLV